MKNIFETLKLLEEHIAPLKESEIISLENALGRVLACDLYAKKNLPSFNNAALDGYAFNYDDINAPLKIMGTILAGDKTPYKLKKNECFKIMTGALMPENADTILMLEEENLEKGFLVIKTKPKRFNAFRFKGEEQKEGELLLKRGQKLNAAMITLLAAQGIYKIKVIKKPSVAVFSSGNELKEPWEECDSLSIYNANALAVQALLNDYNPCYLGIIKDEFNASLKALQNNQFDLIITSGGASVGEADFMDRALKELEFKEIFNEIKARPAKPTKLYQKDNKLILILPGNPMAAFLSCFIFAKKILNLLEGNTEKERKINALMGEDLKLKARRNNLILGNLENGIFTPFNHNQFGSAMILPLVKSTFLLISKEEQESILKGESVQLIYL
ncbi:molybdopterin molybdotransferase MoeA [Campylobacter vulpis]|uniref:molybdopterin molybdotransferase MoeA n=1 Tax=Campylobacter vulpis TaxID=1655500 RepID=UPI001BCB3462|nr:molybdopterin molybdotransferase MoeA [Campylobacter vulpis]MBS4235685.1 molybdopterin molybdotransferase MoeA [Campylobacter vulpis]MBS4269260.1 molybdopterin molybdotransferase MoeA [Campylobacter vulpis]MBS4313965.1 molybdopterin molybdotransferase MoeA [Campylobacter vulpis]